jgi:hypothetical protein
MLMSDYDRNQVPPGQPPKSQTVGGLPFILPPLAILLFGAVLFGVSNGRAAPASNREGGSGGVTTLSQIFTPEIQYWNGSIQQWAQDSDLDPNLIATVMQIESCGDPSALSSAGAIGLFQVMPYHFLESEQPFSPRTNATRGLGYLQRSLEAAEHNANLALAGYNGGLAVISMPEWQWPSETQRYSYWGAGIYADASRGAGDSTRLTEWLAAGGDALCRAARQRLDLQD